MKTQTPTVSTLPFGQRAFAALQDFLAAENKTLSAMCGTRLLHRHALQALAAVALFTAALCLAAMPSPAHGWTALCLAAGIQALLPALKLVVKEGGEA